MCQKQNPRPARVSAYDGFLCLFHFWKKETTCGITGRNIREFYLSRTCVYRCHPGLVFIVVIPDLCFPLSSRTCVYRCHPGLVFPVVIPDFCLSLSSRTFVYRCHPGLVPGSLICTVRDPPDKPGDDKSRPQARG
jgi:hypothetical protein